MNYCFTFYILANIIFHNTSNSLFTHSAAADREVFNTDLCFSLTHRHVRTRYDIIHTLSYIDRQYEQSGT